MKKGLKSIFILFVIVCFGCKSDTTKLVVTNEVVQTEGEALAKIHCARCHSFPEPSVMPKRYWKEVLPFMGFHLGKAPKGKTLSDFKNEVVKKRLDASGLFPSEDMISDYEWQAIIDFYDKNSPENLPANSLRQKPKVRNSLSRCVKQSLRLIPCSRNSEIMSYS